jgi:hypothetical protein
MMTPMGPSPRRNRFRVTLADLERSTGHAPGEELVEIEPEVEHHYEPPMRVTPMSPASEVQALGQLTWAAPERKRWARAAALLWLVPLVLLIVWGAVSQFR